MSLTHIGPEQIARRLYKTNREHTPLAGLEAIDDAAIQSFHRDGFLAVANVFTPAEVQAASDALTDLIMGRCPGFWDIRFEEGVDVTNLNAEQREKHVRKVMDFVPYEPRLAHVAGKKSFVEVVNRIVGSNTNMIQDMAMLKPPGGGREKPWHQDTAYFMYEPLDGILGTWIAVDPATQKNGCMHVIPGSNRLGPQPHYHDRDCQLPDETIDTQNVLAVPLQPGGVLFFSGLLHHGTPANNSMERRRALQFHYASVNCRKIDVDQHEKMFHDPAGYAGCRTWDTGKPIRSVNERAV